MAISSTLVTGGAGFLGRAIVRELQDKYPDCEITILDQHPNPQAHIPNSIKYVQADITSPAELKNAFEKVRPQVVIHTAAIIPTLDERFVRRMEKIIMRVNVDGTRNVLKAAIEAGTEGFVYTSSASALIDNVAENYANVDERWPPPPMSYSYGESKVQAEALVIAANSEKMPTCVLRPAVIFGPGDQHLIPPIHACIAKGETPYKLGRGNNLWDVVYIDNVAYAHMLAATNLVSTKSAAGEIFFIQNNEPTSFREFSLAVWREFGHYPPFEITIPRGLGYFLGWLNEWYTFFTGGATTLSRGAVLDACAVRYASGEKAKRILGYQPRVGLEEGIHLSCRVSHEIRKAVGKDENLLSPMTVQDFARRLASKTKTQQPTEM